MGRKRREKKRRKRERRRRRDAERPRCRFGCWHVPEGCRVIEWKDFGAMLRDETN